MARSSVLWKLFEDILEALSNTAKPEQGIEILAKLHPMEPKNNLNEIADKYKDKIKITINTSYDTKQAVLASDLILGAFSTVLVEASYMDKPAISIQPDLIGDDKLITNSLGVTPAVYKKEGITPILQKAIFSKKYQAELSKKRASFKTDGRATERVCKIIYDMFRQDLVKDKSLA